MAKNPRRTNLKPRGRCIFCGGFNLTHEHIFADWLKAYIPRQMVEHRTRRAKVHPIEGTKEAPLERRPGDPHGRRIYCVCKSCNSGWMSHLQEKARPFLVPMLVGQTTKLHRRAQKTVAAWIAVMVMVSEFIDRSMVAVPQADRLFVREKEAPPLHWRIWIGAHSRQKFPLFTHNSLEFVDEKPEIAANKPTTAPNTQTTTICLGENLLIHVMSSAIAKNIVRKWNLPGSIGARMSQIWPYTAANIPWSPTVRLADAAIELLADDFFDKANSLIRDRTH